MYFEPHEPRRLAQNGLVALSLGVTDSLNEVPMTFPYCIVAWSPRIQIDYYLSGQQAHICGVIVLSDQSIDGLDPLLRLQ